MLNTEAEILFEVRDDLGVMTLNRPKALNALSTGMIREMERVLPVWESDPAVKAVIVQGAGGKAFCAGGDVAFLAREARDNPTGTGRRDFFREEYIVNRRIYRFAKPWISLVDGIDMGGGVGLSVHGTYSIATEKFLFAMPETAIALFPDVGGGYFLNRLPGALGVFLALTGHRLKAADALWAGIVQAYVPSEKLVAVTAALAAANFSGTPTPRKVATAVASLVEDPGEPTLPAMMDDIDRCFSAETVEEIIAKLKARGGEWAEKQLTIMGRMSPLSLKITLEQLRRCANRSFEDVMTIEYRMSQACMKPGHDFFEGVRAVLIDKDQKPKFTPTTLAEVTPAMVDDHFRPVDNDLFFG